MAESWTDVFCDRPAEMAALKDAFRRSLEPNSGPQLVVLLAEAGMGKTRLAQEFYSWLVTEHRAPDGLCYWPRKLAQSGDNLQVNPPLGEVRHEMPMPFVWWGLRLPDPGGKNQFASASAVASYMSSLTVHLEFLYRQRRESEYRSKKAKSWRDWLTNSALNGIGMIPHVGVVAGPASILKDTATLYREISDIRRDHRSAEQWTYLRPDLLQERHQLKLADALITDLSEMLDAPSSRSVPFVVFIDDAQWASFDPLLVDVVKRLWNAAQCGKWNLILIAAHWETEWHSDRDKPTSFRAAIDTLTCEIGSNWAPVRLGRVPDLEPLLAVGLPGLSPSQRRIYTKKSDGNPQLLTELIRWSLYNPALFEGRDINARLTPAGETEVDDLRAIFKELAALRFARLPARLKAVLAISASQDMRFLAPLTLRICARIPTGGEKEDVNDAINLHGIINCLGPDVYEFSNRTYWEVAYEYLPNLASVSDIREASSASLRELLEPLVAQWPKASESQKTELLCGLFVKNFEQSEDLVERSFAAAGLFHLAVLRIGEHDFDLALQYARRFSRGALDGRWDLNLFFGPLWDELIGVMLAFLGPQEVLPLAELKFRQDLETLAKSGPLSFPLFALDSLKTVARLRHMLGDTDSATALLRFGLRAARDMAELNGAAFLREEIAHWIVEIAKLPASREQSDEIDMLLDEAFQLYLTVSGTADTADDYVQCAKSLTKLAGIFLQRNRLQQAEPACRETLALLAKLRPEDDDSQAQMLRSETSLVLAHISRCNGDLRRAEKLLRECVETRRKLIAGADDLDGTVRLCWAAFELMALFHSQARWNETWEICGEILKVAEALNARLDAAKTKLLLVMILRRSAHLHAVRGEFLRARDIIGRCEQVARSLSKQMRAPEVMEETAEVLQLSAQLSVSLKSQSAAKSYYLECLDLRLQMVAFSPSREHRWQLSTVMLEAARLLASSDPGKAEALAVECVKLCRGLVRESNAPAFRESYSRALIGAVKFARKREAILDEDKYVEEYLANFGDVERAL